MTHAIAYHPRRPRFLVDGERMSGRGPERKPYHAHPALIAAANVALTCRLPLLLTGEPGCGKTDFAFALARKLHDLHPRDWISPEPLQCNVRSDSRARDLLYHYDAVGRFADAQLRSAARDTEVEVLPDDPCHYIELDGLGAALAATSPRVVLIDEIDKAPRDLPNDLLQPLDRRGFEIPEIPPDHGSAARPCRSKTNQFRRSMGRPTSGDAPEDRTPPLVVITSNVERQLPDPFLRRCVFFHIEFPDDASLKKIMRDWVGGDEDDSLRDRALRVFRALRHKLLALAKRPTTSELIAWTQALVQVFDPAAARRSLDAFCAKLDAAEKGSGTLAALPWSTLPVLGCLVKLREDLEHLGVTVVGSESAR